MCMYGQDYAYADNRLSGTIVRDAITGRPVKVFGVNQDGYAHVVYLDEMGTMNEEERVIKLEDLDVRPVPLGYVNFNGSLSYLYRIPVRRDWKQGLRANNCASVGLGLANIPGSNLSKTIMGVFPSFAEVKRTIKNNIGHAYAWHRHWATDGKRLYYKRLDCVGTIFRGKPKLTGKCAYLKEALEEAMA